MDMFPPCFSIKVSNSAQKAHSQTLSHKTSNLPLRNEVRSCSALGGFGICHT